MGAIINQLQNLEILEDSFLGKNSIIEKDFLQNLELSFQEENFNQKTELSNYVGKCCICVTFESQSLPGHGDVFKQVELTEEHFSPKKKIKRTWLVGKLHDG